jgi:Domain of unknown function (DUF4167)
MNTMMRKNNNRGGNKHRGGGNSGGQRRYNNNGGGGNRSNANDGQNLQRQKHHATQQLGKYSDLARNAQINGDRVDVEYYLQHVDHYTRVLTDIANIEAERFAHTRESQIIPGGPNDPNAQAHQQQTADQAGSSDGENGGDAHAQTAISEGGNAPSQQAEFTPSNQPRMSRQRRPHHSEPREPSDNGAREANSNTTDIPLPGGILPPI